MKGRLFIFGTGQHAQKVFNCAVACGYKVGGFIDENISATPPVPGVQVFHSAALQYSAEGDAAFIAIGRSDVRRRLMDKFANTKWQLPALVHPFSCVAPDVNLGAGVLVAAGAVIESSCIIGRGVIVDVGVIIDHGCRIAEFSHLKPGQVCPPQTEWDC